MGRPKYGTRADRNQREIMQAFRDIGAYPEDVHDAGYLGFDLLVYHRGRMYAVEVKTPGRYRLTNSERLGARRRALYGVPTYVVRTVQDCADMVAGELAPIEVKV